MHNEFFYAVLAQVLPTLLIAVVLEFKGFVPYLRPGGVRDVVMPKRPIIITYWTVVSVFVVAEMGVLGALLWGTAGWLVWPAMIAAVLGFVVLVAAALSLPASWLHHPDGGQPQKGNF